MNDIFNETVEPGTLPDPQDPKTFEHAKLAWDDYALPEHVAGLNRFRELTALRRELLWPLTAGKCLNAWSARQGDGLIVTWQYETGTYNMLLNPTGAVVTVVVSVGHPTTSTGHFEFADGRVRVGPWSALVWRS